MIDEIDRRLTTWIQETLGDIQVSLEPPRRDQSDGDTPGPGVGLYLLSLAEEPPLRSTKPAPLQLSLRYLVTAWAPDVMVAHRLLGELAFAAMDDPEVEIDLTPVAMETWVALEAAPQPACILRVPLRRERPTRPTRRVRHPLDVHVAPTKSLQGRVVGPESVPIMGASVELVDLERTTRTDVHGDFMFKAVPAEPAPQALLVRVKGKEFEIAVKSSHFGDEPLVIHIDLSE